MFDQMAVMPCGGTDYLPQKKAYKSTIGSELSNMFKIVTGNRDFRFEKEILPLIRKNKDVLDTDVGSINSYIKHYSNIINTEEVTPKRLGNMKGVLTLNVDGARKTVKQDHEDLEKALSGFGKLSKEQTEMITAHTEYVNVFLDNLPELYNEGQIQVSFGEIMIGRFDEDGSLTNTPRPEQRKQIEETAEEPVIEADYIIL